MAYCDFPFYRDEFHGTVIPEGEFPQLAERASDWIRAYTAGASDTAGPDAMDAVRRCTCALAEVERDEAQMRAGAFASGGVKTSETVGPWSRGYSSGLTASAMDYLRDRRRDLLWLWLHAFPEFSGLFKTRSWRCTHEARRCRRG